MTSVSFCTAYQFAKPNLEKYEKALEFVDDYFCPLLGSMKATVIEINNEMKIVMMPAKERSLRDTCLIIISYATLIFPFLMFLAKVLLREVAPEGTIDMDLTRRLPSNPSLHDYYMRKGVFSNFTKPIEVDINALGLDLDEELQFDMERFPVIFEPHAPLKITMRQAVNEIVAKINQSIRNNPTESLQCNRTVSLKPHWGPWHEEGSNLFFYDLFGPTGYQAKPSYLVKILESLKTHDQIHSFVYANETYTVKV